jgi:hypothetical protein
MTCDRLYLLFATLRARCSRAGTLERRGRTNCTEGRRADAKWDAND